MSSSAKPPGLLARLWRRIRPQRRLKLTREGRYFIAITVGIGLAAINTGNNLLYLLLGWLLSVIIASGAMSDMSMRRLRVSRRPPGRLHANRPFLMEISIENRKRKLASYSVEVEDLVDRKPLDKKCYFLKIPPSRTQKTSYRHTFSRRGLYRFDGFRIATKFPFALFHKSRDLFEHDEVLVFPAIHPVPLPAPRAHQLGSTQQNRVGRRGEFFGLREYRDGDDRRGIHWRSSARQNRLLVREFEEEAQRQATIFVDNALPDDADDDQRAALEAGVSLAASLAQSYIKLGYGVRLVARGMSLPFSTGESHLIRMLKALALLETVSDEIQFSSSPEPAGESLLIVPKGVNVNLRPGNVTHVMEAGA